MAPVAYGVLATVAGVILLGALVGAVGGVVSGRLRVDLFLGAVLSAVALFLLVVALESWSSGEIAQFGLLPLVVTYVIGAATTRLLDSRYPSRPVLAGVLAAASALVAGFLYMMMVRIDALPLLDRGTPWVALGVFSCLMIWSARNRLRALRAGK